MLVAGAGQLVTALVDEAEQQIDARHAVAQLRGEVGLSLAAQAVVGLGRADHHHPLLLADHHHRSAARAGRLGQQPGLGGGQSARSTGGGLVRLQPGTVAPPVAVSHDVVGQQQGGAVHQCHGPIPG